VEAYDCHSSIILFAVPLMVIRSSSLSPSTRHCFDLAPRRGEGPNDIFELGTFFRVRTGEEVEVSMDVSAPSTDRRIGRGVWAMLGGIIRLL
jgi:hypothetical protein